MRWKALLLTSASRQLQRQGNGVTSEALFREFPVAAWGAAESPREAHCGAAAARPGSNMSVSEACSARLLLVLAAWALADANSSGKHFKTFSIILPTCLQAAGRRRKHPKEGDRWVSSRGISHLGKVGGGEEKNLGTFSLPGMRAYIIWGDA